MATKGTCARYEPPFLPAWHPGTLPPGRPAGRSLSRLHQGQKCHRGKRRNGTVQPECSARRCPATPAPVVGRQAEVADAEAPLEPPLLDAELFRHPRLVIAVAVLVPVVEAGGDHGCAVRRHEHRTGAEGADHVGAADGGAAIRQSPLRSAANDSVRVISARHSASTLRSDVGTAQESCCVGLVRVVARIAE